MHKEAFFQRFINRFIWDTRYGAPQLEDPNTPINGFTVAQIFGGTGSTGTDVTTSNAIEFSAVWACVRIISGIISYLPLQIYQKTATGRELASDDPLYKLITGSPGKYLTKPVFFERAIYHLLLWGNHLAEIKYNGAGQVARLRLIHPSTLYEIEEGPASVVYVFRDSVGNETKINGRNILHVPHLGDGLAGKSTIKYAREDISLEFSSRDYGANWFNGGGQPSGVITTERNLTPAQHEDAKKVFQRQKDSGGDVVLPVGLKYEAIKSIPPQDAEWVASRKFSVATIARWFGVPLEKLQDMDRATFANIEHNAISFLQDTIMPICKKFEAEYASKMITDTNKYFEFNIDAYLKADSLTKHQVLQLGINNGMYTVNEARQKLNLNDVDGDGGNKHWIQMNMKDINSEDDGQTSGMEGG